MTGIRLDGKPRRAHKPRDEAVAKRAAEYRALQLRALELGKELASNRGESVVFAFDDSLPGDIARFEVIRLLRKERPELEHARVSDAVKEMLEP